MADAARWLTDIGDVRAVVAEAVQRRMCSVEHLVEELEHGPKQGSALLRRALAEVADGVRSAAEGQLRALIERSGGLSSYSLFSDISPAQSNVKP